MTNDQAHVLLDAINIAREQADATNYQPWNGYDDEWGDDPKAKRLDWFGLLDAAAESLEALLAEDGGS